MIWYRNGSADDPLGQSGIAHFLEHLMFKGTEKHPAGEFSKVVSGLGGQENAFTSFDYTAYFQRVAREHLKTMMEFEADRMTNLLLDEAVIAPERDVVLEERRMRVETDPSAQLSEAMAASLFVHHPYGIPIIGWMHEIETLNREHALDYYNRFYTPENAILVVAGDVTADEVRRLAEATYGRSRRGASARCASARGSRSRVAARHITVADPKVEQPTLQRLYLVPSCCTADAAATAMRSSFSPSDRRRPDLLSLPQARAGARHRGECGRLVHVLGHRRHALLRLCGAGAGRLARGARRGGRRRRSRTIAAEALDARCHRARQDPPRRRDDLFHRQPILARPHLRLGARHRRDASRMCGAGRSRSRPSARTISPPRPSAISSPRRSVTGYLQKPSADAVQEVRVT